MREKKFVLFFLILVFGMCGSDSSIEVNELVEEDKETAQTDTDNKSDLVSKDSQGIAIENIKSIDHYGTSSHLEIVDDSTLRLSLIHI